MQFLLSLYPPPIDMSVLVACIVDGRCHRKVATTSSMLGCHCEIRLIEFKKFSFKIQYSIKTGNEQARIRTKEKSENKFRHFRRIIAYAVWCQDITAFKSFSTQNGLIKVLYWLEWGKTNYWLEYIAYKKISNCKMPPAEPIKLHVKIELVFSSYSQLIAATENRHDSMCLCLCTIQDTNSDKKLKTLPPPNDCQSIKYFMQP